MWTRNSTFFTVVTVVAIASLHNQTIKAQESQEKKPLTILQKLNNGSIRFTEADQALEELTAAIKEDPDANWSGSAISLAGALAHNGDFDKAVSLVHDRYKYRLNQAKQNGKLLSLAPCVNSIVEHCVASSRPNLGNEVLDDFIPAFRNEISQSAKKQGWQFAQLAKLVGIRCQSLGPDKAEEMLQKELQQALEFHKQNPDESHALSSLIEIKKILAVGDYPGGTVNLKTVDELLPLVEETKPNIHKIVWGLLVYDTYRYLIQNLMFDHPEKAAELRKIGIDILESESEGDDSFKAMFQFRVDEFKSFSKKIGRYESLKQLIGTQAAEFDSAAWINGKESTLDELSGKVVLLDFTAVWCGPCIQLIPGLNSMHREFADQGLATFSVTKHQEFIWDKEKNMAIKSGKSTGLENQINLQKGFVTKHRQQFPLMICREDTEMFKSYGVVSIPHAVLIDRNGIIREIIIGNTETGKRRLKRRVRELMAKH